MFDLDIIDNTKLTLEVSENYLKKIIDEPNDVKNYKMLILNLHNALELTFKFLLQSRNDFMIYEMQDKKSFNSVIEAYKSIRKQRKRTNEKMPSQKVLHTVSFTNAYEILAYLYNVEGFNEKFIFKLERLNTLRNGLTHFKARIEHTDIIVLYNLFEECVNLYNSELDSDRHAYRKLIDEDDRYDRFKPNRDLAYEFSSAIEDIKMKLLDEPIIKELIGFLIKKMKYVNSDINLDDYEKLLEFFLEKQERVIDIESKEIYKSFGYTESEFEAALRESKVKEKNANKRIGKIKKIFKESDGKDSFEVFVLRAIFILLESDFIYSRTYYQRHEFVDLDIMGGLSLTVSCKDIILKKWNNDSDSICKAFDLSQEEYYILSKFQGDHDSFDDIPDDYVDNRF